MRRYTLSLRNDLLLIAAARIYYEKHLYECPDETGGINNASRCKSIPKWHEAFTLNFCGNQGVVIPIDLTNCVPFEKTTGAFALSIPPPTLLLYKDYTDSFHIELVTLVPDSPGGVTTLQSFTGFIIPGIGVSNLIRVHTVIQNPATDNRFKKASGLGHKSQVDHHPERDKAANKDPDKPAAPIASHSTFAVTTGDRLISNIKDYLKCFDNIPNNDHTYQIKLCVLQPTPGSRDPWAFYSFSNKLARHNPVFVGHTYLILTAITPAKTTTRNVGFYPKDTVHPLSPASQGVLNNDEEQDYDIALSIATTSSQFFNVLNYILKGNDKGFNYNLNTNNCTTFAVDALAAGFIVIPRTIGTWSNGKGMNPGDLGEDIRKMKPSSGISITTTVSSHPNIGTCV